MLWQIDGVLQAEPSKFSHGYPLNTLAQSVMGAPNWLNSSIFTFIKPFVGHWPWWNLASVLLELAIGACLISARFVRSALVASFVWAAIIWWVGEGLGMLPSGFALMAAGAPGAAVLYVILGGLAWPKSPGRALGDVNAIGWRVAWTILWVGAAFLHLPVVYPARQVLVANLATLADGAPRVLAHISAWMIGLSKHHSGTVVVVLALVELAIGLAPWLAPRRAPLWLGLSILVSLFFWVVFQQFGTIFTPDATDPNSGPLMILLALVAWPRRREDRADSLRPEYGGTTQ
ncbi:MAG: hypothetical protein ACRD0E_05755 [Acidimicrobiales bacterium]